MQLYRWQGAARNFGDELNLVLWPWLLPNFFDNDPTALFLGIGSVLHNRHNSAATKLVAGAGYGGYLPPPVPDASWVIHWVRGPRTARVLGLPAASGLGDPAMLLPAPAGGEARFIGFMPHFESLIRGAWAEVAATAGIRLIDPRDDPQQILAAIAECRLLLSEAMHGAIVADAMRVPWIALRPLMPIHRPKWQDWADTLGLQVRFQPLAASCLGEHLLASGLGTIQHGRWLLERATPLLSGAAHCRFVEQAAGALTAAAAATPQLSTDAALDRCRAQMLERLEALRRDPWNPGVAALRRDRSCAYHG